MSVIVRLDNRDVIPAKVDIKVKQNKIGTMKVTVPIDPFISDGESERTVRDNLKLQDIEIYQGDILMRSGYVKDVQPASLGKTDGFLLLTCEDELGKLSLIWSKPDAHYQDAKLTDIVTDILTLATDWELGDTSTMDDVNATTTVNARSKERLWAQVTQAVENVPKCFIRYGGFNDISQNHKLDIGLFAEEDDSRYAINGDNLFKDPKVKRNPNDIIERIRPQGGRGGDLTIELDGGETPVSGFPITLDVPTGKYYVSNNNVSNGIWTARTYNHIRTQNSEPPTSIEINEARQALYDATVRELEVSEEIEVLTLDCSLTEFPLIGQNIRVRAVADVETYDILTQAMLYRNRQNIDGSYRITEIGLVFNKSVGLSNVGDSLLQDGQDGFRVKLQTTDGLDLARFDKNEYLAKRFERHEDGEPFGAGIGLGGVYAIEVFEGTGQATDCNTGVRDGRQFTFNFDPIPSANIRAIDWAVRSVDNGQTYSVVQEPALPSTPLILCVSGAGDTNWTVASSATVVVEYTYFT